MQQLDDSFALHPEAQAIVEQLIVDLEEFSHLTRARVVCVLSQRTPRLHGHPCHAFIGDPKVQGSFKWLFDWLIAGLCKQLLEGDEPDFLVMIDAATWSTLDDVRRERLMYHELCHLQPKEAVDGRGIRLDDEGRPQLMTVPHDTEIFNAELLKYGPEICGDHVVATLVAGAQGAKEARTRERRSKLALVD